MKTNIKTALIFACLALGLAPLGNAASPTTTVTLLTDSATPAPGELRYVIQDAASGDTIGFSPSLYNQTINLTQGALIVDKPLTLDGEGNSITVRGPGSGTSATIDIMHISANGCVIRNLSLQNSNDAILFEGSATINTLTVENCRIGIGFDDIVGASTPNNFGIAVAMATGGQINLRSNVITGNKTTGWGVGIAALFCSNLSITNNYIGTTSVGLQSTGNNRGIVLDHCSSGTIGGNLSAGNIIAGNGERNVFLSNSNTINVYGNRIGLSSLGTALTGNGIGIVLDTCNQIRIGQPSDTAAYYNQIGGNTTGIDIIGGGSYTNRIQSNYIGVNASATPVSNTSHGVHLNATFGNLIGGNRAGANSGEGNVICSNGGDGVLIDSGEGNTICGNYIGTNTAGNLLANTNYSINLSAAHNLIGGPNTNPSQQYGNYICGAWVNLNAGANNTAFQGNFVGINPATGLQQGSDSALLYVGNVQNCMIGGASDADRNFFCGTFSGVLITGLAASNQVINNWIGVLPNGAAPATSLQDGIELLGTSTNNTIGQMSPPLGNLIANVLDGIASDTTVGNAFYANTICAFSLQGINFTNSANNNKLPPTISLAGPISVGGAAQAGDTVELFISERGAGVAGGSLRHIAFCTADGSGAWTYPVVPGDGVLEGVAITAMGTDTSHNTSPFSLNVAFHGPTPTPSPTFSPSPTITQTPATMTPTATATSMRVDFQGRQVLAFPNPGRDRIRFAVRLEQTGDVKIEIYNLMGERVAELAESFLPAGTAMIGWDCHNTSPGVYMARVFIAGKKIATVRIGITK